MKKLALILMFLGLFFTQNSQAQSNLNFNSSYLANPDDSAWDFGGGKAHIFSMNYTLFGKNYARGLWYGSAGYAAGMYLSNHRTGWGIVGSLVAVNLPLLLDNQYGAEEVWIGRNLGALTVSAGFTIYVEMSRSGKATWKLPYQLRKQF